jgi:hypothetical protein
LWLALGVLAHLSAEGEKIVKRCYACELEIPADNRRSYRVGIDFCGNEEIGGHRRSIEQDVCSSGCLAAVLESVAADLRSMEAPRGPNQCEEVFKP